MARTAVKEADEIGVQKIDFARALRIMRTDVKSGEEENASSRGDLSAAWKIITDECKLDSAAAKFFRKNCLEASEEKKDGALRTLYGLLKAAGIGISRDLVDQMGDGGAPTMPIEKSDQERRDADFEAAAPKNNSVTDEELDSVVGDVPEKAAKRPARRPNLVTVN